MFFALATDWEDWILAASVLLRAANSIKIQKEIGMIGIGRPNKVERLFRR